MNPREPSLPHLNVAIHRNGYGPPLNQGFLPMLLTRATHLFLGSLIGLQFVPLPSPDEGNPIQHSASLDLAARTRKDENETSLSMVLGNVVRVPSEADREAEYSIRTVTEPLAAPKEPFRQGRYLLKVFLEARRWKGGGMKATF